MKAEKKDTIQPLRPSGRLPRASQQTCSFCEAQLHTVQGVLSKTLLCIISCAPPQYAEVSALPHTSECDLILKVFVDVVNKRGVLVAQCGPLIQQPAAQ